MAPVVGFITDTEGNFDYWSRCVGGSSVVCFDADQQLQFARPHECDVFVFGGDVFDKGPGDIRIAGALVDFKRRHPDRVFLLVGNRDLNKLRFTAELGETDIDVPQPVPLYPRAPPQRAYRDFLRSAAEARGTTVEQENTRANRVRWILAHTMTANGAFEFRRQELALLRANGDGAAPSDEEVAEHFVKSVSKEDDGFVWQYLEHGQLAALVGGTLFLHGGLPAGALGWIPGSDLRYLSPGPSDVPKGRTLSPDHTIQQWVDEMNAFYRESLQDYLARPLWQEGRVRGGEVLLVLTSTPACFQRSVVVESLLRGGQPAPLEPQVEAYLAERGVRRLVCGHKPCGDSPFVVRGSHVEVLHCDTTFSDQAAKDKRGQVFAVVEVEGVEAESRAHLRGVLRDGSPYDFWLPAPGPNCLMPPAKRRAGAEPDTLVGRQTHDAWWVKARLATGDYLLSTGKLGERDVVYKVVAEAELQREALVELGRGASL